MKKKHLIFFLIVLGIVAFLIVMISTGGISFDTFGQNEQTKKQASSVDELADGCYYIWHNENSNDIKKDLEGIAASDVFKLCPSGSVNWDSDSFIAHTVWFSSSEDVDIPTLYPGDKLLYVSSTKVPYEGIEWERFSDYGYTIGVANMIGDTSGHYRIENVNGDGFDGYVYRESDVNQLNENFSSVATLFLDKIGGSPVREESMSDGGTILNLDKDKDYICEWYTGTIYQDFKMKANIHTFGALESFTTYDYDFLHSNCIEIKIPEWFKTGYYYVAGTGMFRYVALGDETLYNGSPYDRNINWNAPIKLYDDFGNLIYDPSTGVDKRNEEGTSGEVQTESIQSQSGSNEDGNIVNEGDAGVEEYEEFGTEIIYDDTENTYEPGTEGETIIQ